MPAPPDPLTLREVAGRTMLADDQVDRLFAGLLQPEEPARWQWHRPVTAPEAAATWLYGLLIDTLGDHATALEFVALAWPNLRLSGAWLEGPTGPTWHVRIHDRRLVEVGGLPPFDLEAGEHVAAVVRPLETLQFDVLELYRRNLTAVLEGRKKGETCLRSA